MEMVYICMSVGVVVVFRALKVNTPNASAEYSLLARAKLSHVHAAHFLQHNYSYTHYLLWCDDATAVSSPNSACTILHSTCT